MIKKALLLFLISCPMLLFGQFEVSINAYVLDGITNKPIEFVNIGFADRGIGTVSNTKGLFELNFDEEEVGLQAALQFSALGYKTKTLTVDALYRLLESNNIIYLNPITYDLEEVILTNEARKNVVLGNQNVNPEVMGYWKDKKGLGGEIATRVRVSKERTRLEELSFEIVENESDSLKVRVKIYDYKQRYPGKNLLTQNIFKTVTSKEGKVTINLKPFNIYVNQDVVVSIELVEVFGDAIGFAIASSTDRGIAYTRSISQDSWVRFPSVGMGFSVKASVPQASSQKEIERKSPERVTLYWDVSYAMRDRNYQEEFSLLSSYFKKLGSVQVEVVKFSAGWQERSINECNRGDCGELFDYLKQSNYLGAADYSQILNENTFDAQAILLFSNGSSVISSPKTSLNLPIFSVNSLSDANHIGLQDLSLFADGHYIDLSRIEIGNALTLMLTEVEDDQVYSFKTNTLSKIYGQVISDSGPIQGATIKVKGTFKEVSTNQEGDYSISAQMDDVLEVSALGMLDMAVLVAEDKKLDIVLSPDGQLLDEVLIEAQKQEELVKTAYGKRARRSLGVAIDFILAEDIPVHYTSLAQLLSGRAGIQVLGFGTDAQFIFSRSIGSSINNSILPVIVVDGILYQQDQRPQIDIQNIDNVAILKGVAATNRYGSLAAFGAIVIETKTFAITGEPIAKKKQALVSGNDYSELTPVFDAIRVTPDYIVALNKSTTFEAAKTTYFSQLNADSDRGIDYFINVASYFESWDKQYSFFVASNIAGIAPDNVKALRALGYYLEQLERYEALVSLYNQVKILEPSSSQAYRDLALAYTNAERYNEAFEIYKGLISRTIKGVQLDGMGKVIENELRHFMVKHKNKVRFSDLPSTLLTADFKYDMRLVFEYNDPSAQFEMQFVNPKNKFFNWRHTIFDDKERLQQEVANGYNMQEYVIEGDSRGRWVVNMVDLSESDSQNPTYLKVTLYKNYGQKYEAKKTILVNMAELKTKATLLEFSY